MTGDSPSDDLAVAPPRGRLLRKYAITALVAAALVVSGAIQTSSASAQLRASFAHGGA